MIWTPIFMRTVFICLLLVTTTTLAQGLDGDVNTWIQLDDGMTMGRVLALEAGENRLYAGASNGIFISQDNGRTWHPTLPEEAITAITAIAIDGETVYAGAWAKGVFRSDDAGVTWKPLQDGLRCDDVNGECYYGEVEQILITRDKIFNVMFWQGTYTSTDKGETWHEASREWALGARKILSMREFDGYLWKATDGDIMYRSPDNGETWEFATNLIRGSWVNDWAVFNNRLYVAGEKSIGRWNENTRDLEYLMEGLPIGSPRDPDAPPYVSSLAVHDGRLFAGLDQHGVYVFDALRKTWSSAGLDGLSVRALLSYKSTLYAGAHYYDGWHIEPRGIYCAVLSTVQPHGKAVTTWASVKQGALK